MEKNQTYPSTGSRKILLKMFKLLRLILVFFLLSAYIASCETSESVSGGKALNNNILRYDVNAPFTSLNPSEVEATGSTHIFPLLYSYLFIPDTHGRLQPDLAVDWAYDASIFTWIIHLRKNVRFHNHHPVTSEDIRSSIENQIKKIHPHLLFLVNRIFIDANHAIRIKLTKDDPMFLNKIWDTEIIPNPAYHKIDFYNHPIGSGPFKFKYRNKDKEVVLVANEDYYNGRPSLDQIVFYYQPDKEKTWARLLSGDTDIANELTVKNFEMIRQYENRFYFDRYTLPYYKILLYNTNNPLFSDPKIRLALTYAINREYIVKKILKGYGMIAAGPMGSDSPFHNPDVTPIAYDPQKGLKLLHEAGWTNKKDIRYLSKKDEPFRFTIFVLNESQIDKKIARYIQLCLNDIGISVELQGLTYKDFLKRFIRNNQFQAVLAEFRCSDRDPAFIKQLWSPYPADCSIAGCFKNTEVTRLIDQALREKRPFLQKQSFYKIDAFIASLQPGTFLYQQTVINAMSKRFLLPYPFSLVQAGIYRLRFASIKSN